MQRRTFLAMVLSVAGGTWLAGCGGGGGSTSTVGRGGVAGFAFFGPDNGLTLLSTVEEGAAAGLAPATGMRAQIVGTGVSATVGADGSLRLSGIEAGLRTLRLTPNPSFPPVDIPLTVVPDAILPLGQTRIHRQKAVDALVAQFTNQGDADLLESADILASSTPLPAGVVLRLGLPEKEDVTLAAPAWLVYADLFPHARFGHETMIALVDARSGAVQVLNRHSWPTLNGASFYAESAVNATSPDAVRVAPRPTATRSVALDTPMGSVRRSAGSASCRAKDPDTARTHVLMIQGCDRQDFTTDMTTVDKLLSAAPFPAIGTLKKVVTFESTASPNEQFLSAFATVRDTCKAGDTFVLFVTTHGEIDYDAVAEIDQIATTYRVILDAAHNADGSWNKKGELDINGLDFSTCKACRIVLWIDTCYSGNWIPILRPRLEAMADTDILIITAASQVKQASAQEYEFHYVLEGQEYTIEPGGLFTTSLITSVQSIQAAGSAETGVDALAAGFPAAVVEVDRFGKFAGGPFFEKRPQRYLQAPQIFRRALAPDAVCGRGNQ